MLAGISVEYYLRLERGRANHPSPQILDALARALRLDAKATQHLYDLAAPAGPDIGDRKAGARPLAELVDQFSMPAIVANRYLDVVAQIRLHGRCRQSSHPDRTSCAGDLWTRLPASSTLIGRRRPIPR